MAEVSNIDHHFSIRQTRFFMKSVGMWYVDNKRDQIISNGILIYTLLTLTIAMCVVGFDCFYSWGDLYVSFQKKKNNSFLYCNRFFGISLIYFL